MADIIFFKSQQLKDDMFAEFERELKGEFVLAGMPTEILSATMSRLRRIYDLCLARKLDFSFPINPIVRLTVEEVAALKKQIESGLSQEMHARYIAHFLIAAMIEIAGAEGEIYRARRGEIS